MHPFRSLAQVALSLSLVLTANAETHSFTFINDCGYGSPMLIAYGQNVLNSDGKYTSNGPWSGIGYLQTGKCGFNGEQCVLLESTLINPTCAGCGSSTDISLIPPHAYNVETSFAYYGGCDGAGQTCDNADCTNAAFFSSNDNFVQVGCQTDNVNLLVAFCANASQIVLDGGATSGYTTSPTSLLPSTLPTTTTTTTSSLQTSPPPTSPLQTSAVQTSSPVTNSPAAPSSSLPASSLPAPSGTGNSGSSVPVSVPSIALVLSTTPTQSPTETSALGCGALQPTTPIPTVLPSNPATSAPTPTATIPTVLPSNPAGSVPTVATPTTTPPAGSSPAPAPGSASAPTSSPRCRPRPSNFSLSNPAPSGPANASPSVPVPTLSPFTPLPPPATSAGASDPCDDDTVPTTSASTPPNRHRHRRASRIQY